MRWPKYCSFSFSIIPSKEHPGLVFCGEGSKQLTVAKAADGPGKMKTSTALSVTFLKEHCPHCLQWLMCFPPIGQTGHMTILDAREMGKNLLMLVAQMVKRLLTMQIGRAHV